MTCEVQAVHPIPLLTSWYMSRNGDTLRAQHIYPSRLRLLLFSPPRHAILVSVFQQSWAFKATDHTVDSYLEAEVMTRQPYQFTRQIPLVQASWNIVSFLIKIHCVEFILFYLFFFSEQGIWSNFKVCCNEHQLIQLNKKNWEIPDMKTPQPRMTLLAI